MTPLEARAVAKRMFRALAKIPPRLSTPRGPRLEDRVMDNPELFERAAVLADVVLQTDRPEVGEALALAVQGRVTSYSGRFGGKLVGSTLPPGTEATELANAITYAERVLFPPRKSPCMPNAKELRQFVENAHGTGREATQQLRRLNAALREACGYSSYSVQYLERVMSIANGAFRGHGVERAAYEIGDRRPVEFYYVNMGDTYNATLIAGHLGPRRDRFYISTWGDEVERVERRYGEEGVWLT